jgi:two-component system OmpR family sensor kinase
MSARWSLSRRLILSLGAGLGLLWIGGVGVSTAMTWHEIEEVLDSALQETAQRVLPLVEIEAMRHPVGNAADGSGADADDDDDDDEDDDGRAIGGHRADHKEYLIYQVRDLNGRLVLRSHDAPALPFAAPLTAGFSDVDGRRYYTEISDESGLVIQVAEKEGHRLETILDTVTWLLLPVILLVPLAGLIVYWTVRQMLAPIGALRSAIGARSGSDLSPIGDVGLPGELRPIIRDVNRLLERLDLALAGERAFAANSAHELRTPVAAALAQLQRLSAELGPSAHQARIETILASLRRLGQLVEKMLQLARAESGIAITGDAVDLLPVLRLLLEEIDRSSIGAGRIVFDDPPVRQWQRRIDIDAFAIALRNLIDNAIAHGAAAAPIHVFLDRGEALHVVNGGEIVPAEKLARLTERFMRGSTAAEGSGLGLAIAETILAQAGGSLKLYSPALERRDGFEAVIELPPAG